MVTMDVASNHIRVSHEVSSLEDLANELILGIDLIIADLILSRRELTAQENIEHARCMRNMVLQKMQETSYTCEECYQDFKESFQWKELDGWDIDWSICGGNSCEK